MTNALNSVVVLLTIIFSISLFMQSTAVSGDCPDYMPVSEKFWGQMGGDFDECNARLVGPDEVCTGFENPYFVVGEAKSCSKIDWLLTNNSSDKKNVQVWFEGWYGINYGKETSTEKDDKHRLFVEASAEETPGHFKVEADTNDCGCGSASRDVKVQSDRTSPCKKIEDQALCRAWRRLQAITKMAGQLDGKSVGEIIDESFRNKDGTYKNNRNKDLAEALEVASQEIPKIDEDQKVPNDIAVQIERAQAGVDLTDATRSIMEDALSGAPIGNSDDLPAIARLLEEFSSKLHPCSNDTLNQLANALDNNN